jgi:hypothetical protein
MAVMLAATHKEYRCGSCYEQTVSLCIGERHGEEVQQSWCAAAQGWQYNAKRDRAWCPFCCQAGGYAQKTPSQIRNYVSCDHRVPQHQWAALTYAAAPPAQPSQAMTYAAAPPAPTWQAPTYVAAPPAPPSQTIYAAAPPAPTWQAPTYAAAPPAQPPQALTHAAAPPGLTQPEIEDLEVSRLKTDVRQLELDVRDLSQVVQAQGDLVETMVKQLAVLNAKGESQPSWSVVDPASAASIPGSSDADADDG